MKLVPVPSLQVGDFIARDDDKSVMKQIIAITERPQVDTSDRCIWFQFDDNEVVNWRKSKDEPNAWLV